MIKIICVGKIKEKYWRDAIAEYLKRLSKYTKATIIEVEDEGSEDRLRVLEKEKERILKNIKPHNFVISLDIEGETFDSLSLSNKIRGLLTEGYSDIIFIIGGSYGLHDDIKNNSDARLSFSKLTFPHQLFRIMLLEQIYRSFKIINNETYHK
ncbi:MAG: 23S rRNA (pseudouridine(1915)-N(3))-methyltransferase RlmH [Bacilli bacterium]|nr:23S rRNA (pseudouridine(1915)-N(3))-methyltransferase RlmH [Bacilli bacterium]